MSREPKPDFERYMTALKCEEPDRVPLGDWHVDQRPKEAFMGRKLVTLKDHVEFWYQAGFDYVTTSSGILEPVRPPEGITVKGEGVHTEYGDRVSREWAHEHEGVITNWEQFERYPWPSVDDFDLSKWDVLDEILPAGMKAILLLGKIYTPVWMYMGAEVFFEALESNQELVEAMFQKIGQIQYETFLRVVEHPCVGAVIHPDDIAHNTGLLVHPRHLRKYLFPWYKKMSQVCKDRDIGHVFHSDGDCTEVMEDLIECGFDGFHPVQPNAMDIVEVKRRWGKRICLLGNINLDSTLTMGTPEDVRAEVYERIRTIAPGGGYMVSSSNSITDYVPLENMKAMIEATFEFGKYPIQLEEGRVKGKIWTFKGKPVAAPRERPSELDAEAYADALLSAKPDKAVELFQKDLDRGIAASDVLSMGLIPAMALVGQRFQNGQIYIPEMMIAARSMAATIANFKDKLVTSQGKARGKVVIGTVKGDLHDIGKNLVSMMLEGQGFEVKDLGVSVDPQRFVDSVQREQPQILAMSALLTTTMIEMRNVIQALEAAGLRDKVKVIVGGAPVTQSFADQIGADGYAYDAPGAADKCKELLA